MGTLVIERALRFKCRRHAGCDAASWREGPDNFAPPRPACSHKVIQEAVNQMLVKNTFIPEALEIKLQGLELDAPFCGRVGKRNSSEIRLSGLWAEAGEFGTDDFNHVFPAWILIWKSF
jgi:hypothetical protein